MNGAFSGDKRGGTGPKTEGFETKFFWGGWQNNGPQRGREAYFQEIGSMSYGNTAIPEGSMKKS